MNEGTSDFKRPSPGGAVPYGSAHALGFQSLKTSLVLLKVYNDLSCFKT